MLGLGLGLGLAKWFRYIYIYVRLFAVPWTVTCQAPQSMEFSRQKYWSGLSFPPPGDPPDPGIKLSLLHFLYWQADSLPVCHLEILFLNNFFLSSLLTLSNSPSILSTLDDMSTQSFEWSFIYLLIVLNTLGLPWWLRWWRICLQCRRPGFDPWVGKILWKRKWQPSPIFLSGESHGQRTSRQQSMGLQKNRSWLNN